MSFYLHNLALLLVATLERRLTLASASKVARHRWALPESLESLSGTRKIVETKTRTKNLQRKHQRLSTRGNFPEGNYRKLFSISK